MLSHPVYYFQLLDSKIYEKQDGYIRTRVTYCSRSKVDEYFVFAFILLKIESNLFMWNIKIFGSLTIKCLFFAFVVVFLQLSQVYLSVISLSEKWSFRHFSMLALWLRLYVIKGA